MAGSFSDVLENALLDHVFGKTNAYTAPTTLYARLFTATPGDANASGTEVSTGVWTNYAPVAITNNTTNFPNASAGSKSNGAIIDFGTAAITGGPPVVVAVAIYDASSAGNEIAWASLASSKTINNGDPVSFAVSALTITLD